MPNVRCKYCKKVIAKRLEALHNKKCARRRRLLKAAGPKFEHSIIDNVKAVKEEYSKEVPGNFVKKEIKRPEVEEPVTEEPATEEPVKETKSKRGKK